MKKKEWPPAPELTELAQYEAKLPPFIARKEVKYFTGGAVAPSTLARDDSQGKGPLVRQKIGENVIYPTRYLLAWMETKGIITIIPPEL